MTLGAHAACQEFFSVRCQVMSPRVHAQGIWTDNQWCFSVGLDQRLRSWCVAVPHNTLEHDAALAAGEGVCHLLSAEPDCAGAPLWEEGPSTAVQVLEPGALAVGALGPAQGCFCVAVAGRGTQVLLVRFEK